MATSSSIPSGVPRRILAAILAAGLLAQAWILIAGWQSNPLERVPLNDARAYWDWGARIARGDLVDTLPFQSAPLYPYVVGAVRALGGGLAALFALQAVLHVATAWLIARCAGARFGWAAGLVGAALYLMLRDPAFHTGRVLNCTLQAFATAWLWERALAASRRPGWRSALALGGVGAFAVLANPTFAPLLLLLPAWLVWHLGWGARAWKLAGAAALVGVAGIAPATLHNWLASREFVPLSAQAGLGFYHGNQPGADGIYRAAEGVSTDRVRQSLDARDAVRAESDGTWSGTSRAYLRRGLAFWRAEPGEAAVLALKKVWWFLAGRTYGDVYVADLEADDGLSSALALAPMPVAWWTLPALVALCLLARRPREHAPELLLFLATLATVAAFWYSPRYRMPAAPLIAALGGMALVAVARPERSRARAWVFGAALGTSVLLAVALRASGRDRPESFRAQFEAQVGDALLLEGDPGGAALRYERAAALGAPGAAAKRADALRRAGRVEDAIAALRAAVEREPRSAYARRSLAVALAQAGDPAGARAEFEAALRLDPNDAEAESGLGSALLALGDAAAATRHQRRAIGISPGFANAHANLARALHAVGDPAAAEASFREALRLDPRSANALGGLADLLIEARRWSEGLATLRTLTDARAGDRALALNLAWWLATCPDAAARDPRAALARVEDLLTRSDLGSQDLDTLAAVLAANGRFAEAVALAERCLARLRAEGPAVVIPEVEARLELYRAGRAYVASG